MKARLSVADQIEFDRFLTQIGERLKARRAELGLRQEDLDLAPCPMDVRKYQRIEYGQMNFTMQSLYVLSKNLKLAPEKLLAGLLEPS